MLRVAMYLALAALLIGTVLHASNDQAHACVCEIPSKKVWIDQADAIFMGKVISIDRQEIKSRHDSGREYEDIVEFVATDVWKGEPYERFLVSSMWHEWLSSCGGGYPRFREGERYLVFVEQGQANEGACSPTEYIEYAFPEQWGLALGISKRPIPGSVSPIPERVGEPIPTPTVPAPAQVAQPTSEPTAPAPAQDPQPSSGCNTPNDYSRGYADLSAFGLIAPLAWLA